MADRLWQGPDLDHEFLALRYPRDFARRYVNRLRADGEAKGIAKGEARAVLMVLGVRGIEVSDEIRTVIAFCTDLDQIERWLRRAVVAEKIQDLDDPPAGQ